ncbi:MAG TPA: sialidase family protein [Nitriliruptorales bacterium]|nr:sialidase family protein [Nitriliruptorales bacterium]
MLSSGAVVEDVAGRGAAGARRRVVWWRLLLVASLGAVSVAAKGPSTAAPAGQSEAGFTAPVVVSEEDTAEPGIDAAHDGTLYVNAPVRLLPGLLGSASLLWRSDDGGGTWALTPPGLRAAFPGGGDSDVAVDPGNGTVYFSDLWGGSSTASVSEDKGETWFASPLSGLPIHDRQWLATPGGGVVYLTYGQIPLGVMVSKSVDGGRTFLAHSIAVSVADRSGCLCPPGTMVVDAADPSAELADRVGVVYATSTGGIGFARSEDGGSTFVQVPIAPDRQGVDTMRAFPVVASADGDRLVAVWQESVEDQRTLVQFSDSPDWGASWSEPRVLVDEGTPLFPWVDANDAGKVAVSLYHTDQVTLPDTAPEEAVWFERYLESLDGGQTFSPLVTVDPEPVKTGPICTAGANCTEDRELLDFQAVAVDGEGMANVAWTRSVDNVADTQIRFAKQQAGGAPEPATTIVRLERTVEDVVTGLLP